MIRTSITLRCLPTTTSLLLPAKIKPLRYSSSPPRLFSPRATVVGYFLFFQLWDSAKLEPKGTLRGHRRGVWCIAFSTVDKVIASGSGRCLCSPPRIAVDVTIFFTVIMEQGIAPFACGISKICHAFAPSKVTILPCSVSISFVWACKSCQRAPTGWRSCGMFEMGRCVC